MTKNPLATHTHIHTENFGEKKKMKWLTGPHLDHDPDLFRLHLASGRTCRPCGRTDRPAACCPTCYRTPSPSSLCRPSRICRRPCPSPSLSPSPCP